MGNENDRDQRVNYQERDRQVLARLGAATEAERNAGLTLLNETLRLPFETVICKIARASTTWGFRRFLRDDSRPDKNEMDDLWHQVVMRLLENIRKPTYEYRGNLLAYLITIAIREIRAEWEKSLEARMPELRAHYREVARELNRSSDEDIAILRADIQAYWDLLKNREEAAILWADLAYQWSDSEAGLRRTRGGLSHRRHGCIPRRFGIESFLCRRLR